MEAVGRKPDAAARRRPWYTILYIQVLIAIVLGVAIGYFDPDLGKKLKPLGDGFIAMSPSPYGTAGPFDDWTVACSPTTAEEASARGAHAPQPRRDAFVGEELLARGQV